MPVRVEVADNVQSDTIGDLDISHLDFGACAWSKGSLARVAASRSKTGLRVSWSAYVAQLSRWELSDLLLRSSIDYQRVLGLSVWFDSRAV